MTRDRLENAMRRIHSDALHTTSIEVFEPSVSYSAGDGWDVSYPETPNATYDARVESPNPDSEKERSGTDVEIDGIVRVRDDTGQQWIGWGEEAEAAVHVRDADSGIRYEVQTVTDEKDGLTILEVVET